MHLHSPFRRANNHLHARRGFPTIYRNSFNSTAHSISKRALFVCPEVTHQPANTATVQRGAAVAQPAWMWDPQGRIVVCFPHHCLQGFEWCQEHTANANGSLHHSVALSAFYREANSLAVRMPVTQESEDPQIVWTAVNILFSSVLLSSIHREEFIGHLLCTRHCLFFT